jgi:hypothetical protein
VDEALVKEVSSVNRVSAERQILYGLGTQEKWLFCATGATEGLPNESRCDLSGDFHPMPDIAEDGLNAAGYLIGWRCGTDSYTFDAILSGADGRFKADQKVCIGFTAMTILGFTLNGDSAMGEFPVDFTVSAKRSGATIGSKTVTGNTSVNYTGVFDESYQDIDELEFAITRWNMAGAFAKITMAYDNFGNTLDGSDIKTLSVLEEADGALGTLPFGSISANEIDLSLQNVDDKYFRGNKNSDYNNLAKAGRRIEPFIGFSIDGGEKLYMPKGVFWTGDWNIPETGTEASTTARDRLGLLQDVEYNGLGNFFTIDDMATKTYWKNENLYNIAKTILNDLRRTYGAMADLEFDIDIGLQSIVIPLAFFERKSYFDVISTIAVAGSAYAFMDVPTEEEKAEAAERGNTACADILRLKRLVNYWNSGTFSQIVGIATAEALTQRDYVEKTPQLRRDDVVNIASVPYQQYSIVDGVPEADGDAMVIARGIEASILEYGRREYDVSLNNLIQTQPQAEALADGILKIFSGAPITAEINAFGDVTRRIGDKIIVPEYQKHGINVKGCYAVTRIHTEYGDGLRQTLTCRRLCGL